MMKNIDLLIINNCPAFYKINLYNELSKHCSIHVVFLALTNQVVISNEYKKQIDFPYTILEEIQIEKRNKIKCFFKLYSLCRSFKYKKIIVGGYGDSIEFFLLPFLLQRSRNVLQCESTIFESKIRGVKGLIKKILYFRYAFALPTGEPSTELFKTIGFKGEILETKGVGIFHKQVRSLSNEYGNKCKPLRFIYVGRLIAVKNLESLIEVFNNTGYSLTIVGTGELEASLKKISQRNVNFLGFIPNNNLGKIYADHDVFILPSFSEPWGLVVEEAIYWGLPVIVSNAVGARVEMVEQPQTGVVFDLDKKDDLYNAILQIECNYSFYKKNVLEFDFEKRDREQIDVYLKIVKL